MCWHTYNDEFLEANWVARADCVFCADEKHPHAGTVTLKRKDGIESLEEIAMLRPRAARF